MRCPKESKLLFDMLSDGCPMKDLLPKGLPQKVRKTRGAMTLAGFVAVALLCDLSPAAAAHRQSQHRQRDFFAYSGADHPSMQADPPASNGGGCFVTLSAMEATKGIRHFRAGC